MALWTYGDWITQTDRSTRLTRLRLHIQEVSEYAVRAEADGFESEIDRNYMKLLHDKEALLDAQVAATSEFRYGGRNRAHFNDP